MQDERQSNLASIEAQARLAAIIESSDDAIVSKTLEGVVTSWNAGAERIFGYTSEEAIGRPILSLIIPPDRQDEEPQILRRLRNGERVDHFETIRQRKDGRLIHVSVTISPVRDHTGKIIGVSKVARDITLQKQFQSELQAAKDAAEDARRVAEQAKEAAEMANRAKDHFLSVLSHELRTPLTPVLIAVNLIERDGGLPAHMVEHLGMIRRNVETEARLVDDLLDLTRIARGLVQLRQEIVDVHLALRNVVSMFDRAVEEKGLTVALALRAKDFHAWADAGRFQQIVLNLLSNAIKFTPADGTVTIRTSNDGPRLKIEIIDTGIGIESGVLPRLFRPFEQGERTLTRQYGGLGLGLSIAKSLADMHGATISARSEGKDRGTAFTLLFDTVAPAAPTADGGDASGGRTKTHRVLLVEDHQDTREMMNLLLTSFGCVVTPVGTVKDAMEAAERGSFDLLVSDIGLPDGSGLDVMKHVAARSKTPGIALSGFGQDEDLRRSREAGFVTHLTKPVNADLLQEAISKVAS